jgi:hypothetical protein
MKHIKFKCNDLFCSYYVKLMILKDDFYNNTSITFNFVNMMKMFDYYIYLIYHGVTTVNLSINIFVFKY